MAGRKFTVRSVKPDKNGNANIKVWVRLTPEEQMVVFNLAKQNDLQAYSSLTATLFGIPDEKAGDLKAGDTVFAKEGDDPAVRIRIHEYENDKGEMVKAFDCTVSANGCKLSRETAPVATCDW